MSIVGYGLLVIVEIKVGIAAIMEGKSIHRIQFDGVIIVGYSSLVIVEVPVAKSSLDMSLAKIGYYLEKPEQRERVRREGQAFVRQHHTFDQRIHNLLLGEEFHNPLA